MSDEERAIYEQKASEDKERYNEEMKNYREAGPLASQTPSNVQPSSNAMKMDNPSIQDMNNQQPQTVQVQYVDNEGNIIHVVNQSSFVTTSDSNAVYLNNPQGINEGSYDENV